MSIESMCDIHAVEIFTAVVTTGEGMGQDYGYPDAGTPARANVQRASVKAAEKYGIRGTEFDYIAFFASSPPITRDIMSKIVWNGLHLHVIDVLVRYDFDGEPQLWIVPCRQADARKDS